MTRTDVGTIKAWAILSELKARQANRAICTYSPAHAVKGVAATTVITTAIGDVDACDGCKAQYQRMS